MPAPQALKDAILAALDEAYDADGTSGSNTPVASQSFLYYGGEMPKPDVMPAEHVYEVFVDATDGEVISVTVRADPPLLWPDS